MGHGKGSVEMKDFKEDFFVLLNKLKSGEHFAFSRFSDGELRLLQRRELVLGVNFNKIGSRVRKSRYVEEDRKSVNLQDHPHVYEKLMEAYLFKKHNYHVGLSCRCCVGDRDFRQMVAWYGEGDEFLTWANLLINSNYKLFREHFIPEFSNHKIVYILNKKGNLDGLPFKVEKDFRVGSNCIVNDFGKHKEVAKWIEDNDISDHVFLFSASSLSEMMIYELFKEYDNNTYIDIGTTLNVELGMRSIREYMVGGKYAKRTCIW